jgi:large subunit ribosomal protein L15
MADEEERIGLNTLKPAPGSRKARKRVGRGEGSKERVNFEGGQMPIHMRLGKLRGPNKKMSMPFEMFRTHTQPVNLSDLEERFEAGAEVTPDALRDKGLAKRKGIPVKILGKGELTKGLTVHAHAFSASARERIEAAGGTAQTITD